MWLTLSFTQSIDSISNYKEYNSLIESCFAESIKNVAQDIILHALLFELVDAAHSFTTTLALLRLCEGK